VDDLLGLSAYMPLPELHAMMRESDVTSGALLLVDPAREAELAARLKALPAVAGAAFKTTMLQRFRDVIAANMNLSISINLLFAWVIAFGVVYNAARVSLSERSRELASLRVLGFTRAEISAILLGELAAVTLLALPVGAALGYLLTAAIIPLLDSEVFRIPLVIPRQAVGWSLVAVIGAAAASAVLVRRKLDQLDLVGVLKVRE
jgi:putative ABC transport system permease protein